MDLAKTVLRIKLDEACISAVLTDERRIAAASGEAGREGQPEGGVLTYSAEMIHSGLQASFSALRDAVKAEFGQDLATVGTIEISAGMHGCLPFDREGGELVLFQSWRDIISGPAAERLTRIFGVDIPQRSGIAQLYQALLNREERVKDIAFLTTPAGYLFWRLTGEKAVDAAEAGRMFPTDPRTCDYDEIMLRKFAALTGVRLRTILPKVLPEGSCCGRLSEEGARFLDPSGTLPAGIPTVFSEGEDGAAAEAAGQDASCSMSL